MDGDLSTALHYPNFEQLEVCTVKKSFHLSNKFSYSRNTFSFLVFWRRWTLSGPLRKLTNGLKVQQAFESWSVIVNQSEVLVLHGTWYLQKTEMWQVLRSNTTLFSLVLRFHLSEHLSRGGCWDGNLGGRNSKGVHIGLGVVGQIGMEVDVGEIMDGG